MNIVVVKVHRLGTDGLKLQIGSVDYDITADLPEKTAFQFQLQGDLNRNGKLTVFQVFNSKADKNTKDAIPKAKWDRSGGQTPNVGDVPHLCIFEFGTGIMIGNDNSSGGAISWFFEIHVEYKGKPLKTDPELIVKKTNGVSPFCVELAAYVRNSANSN